MRDLEGKISAVQPSNDSDTMAAYLELALKIYLRLKSEGRPIHRPLFDDDHDPLYDQPGVGRPDLTKIP